MTAENTHLYLFVLFLLYAVLAMISGNRGLWGTMVINILMAVFMMGSYLLISMRS